MVAELAAGTALLPGGTGGNDEDHPWEIPGCPIAAGDGNHSNELRPGSCDQCTHLVTAYRFRCGGFLHNNGYANTNPDLDVHPIPVDLTDGGTIPHTDVRPAARCAPRAHSHKEPGESADPDADPNPNAVGG